MLNNNQKNIVEQNHNLIYWYANNNNLPLEEFYDILAIGLCKAAQNFDDSKNNKFSTYAKECMKNAVAEYYRMVNKQINSYTSNMVYIDGLKFDNDENVSYDRFLVDDTTKEDMMYVVEKSNFIKLLTHREKTIVELLLIGYNKPQIAEILQVSRQYIEKIIKTSIRSKWDFCSSIN